MVLRLICLIRAVIKRPAIFCMQHSFNDLDVWKMMLKTRYITISDFSEISETFNIEHMLHISVRNQILIDNLWLRYSIKIIMDSSAVKCYKNNHTSLERQFLLPIMHNVHFEVAVELNFYLPYFECRRSTTFAALTNVCYYASIK